MTLFIEKEMKLIYISQEIKKYMVETESKSKKEIQRHEEDRCITVYYREVHSFLLQALN